MDFAKLPNAAPEETPSLHATNIPIDALVAESERGDHFCTGRNAI